MKFTKLARTTAILFLLAASVINAYMQYRANVSYNKLRSSINDLKNRMHEMRAAANAISRQINTGKCDYALDCGPSDCKGGAIKGSDAKYTVINKNGVLGIFNEEDRLVGKKYVKRADVSDAIKHEEAIVVNGEHELDRLLLSLGCEEE